MAEDRAFIEQVILRECAVTAAEVGARVVGFLALQDSGIRLRHAHPDFVGRGIGGTLLDDAKRAGSPALELRCFQANAGARRFYERHGFAAVRFTDGRDNEEKMPDVRYRWEPPGVRQATRPAGSRSPGPS